MRSVRTYSKKRHSHLSETQRVERAVALTKLGFVDYRAYLRSKKWKRIKAKVMKLDPPCHRCGNPATQVHHASYDYDTLAGLNLKYLFPMCGGCHKRSGHAWGSARFPKVLSGKERRQRKRRLIRDGVIPRVIKPRHIRRKLTMVQVCRDGVYLYEPDPECLARFTLDELHFAKDTYPQLLPAIIDELDRRT